MNIKELSTEIIEKIIKEMFSNKYEKRQKNQASFYNIDTNWTNYIYSGKIEDIFINLQAYGENVIKVEHPKDSKEIANKIIPVIEKSFDEIGLKYLTSYDFIDGNSSKAFGIKIVP